MHEVSPSLDISLAQYSAEEMVAALGLRGAPDWIRQGVARAFARASLPLAQILARFDTQLERNGVHQAAKQALSEFGAEWDGANAVPERGPLLVVANHPGAYDALVLMAAMQRPDLAIIAADRSFLRALPNLSKRLLWVPDDRSSTRRASAVRKALRHLSDGGVLLHFGAGRIEPDPAFTRTRESSFLPWCKGTGALVRGVAAVRGGVIAALVMGVHSPKVKRLLINRIAERFGFSTLAPLLQVTIQRYREVRARVAFSEPCPAEGLVHIGSTDAQLAELMRCRSELLWATLHRSGPRRQPKSGDSS